MIVFTTINIYGNFEAQNEALLSWCDKYKVYSVNPSDEIEIGSNLYPFIEFIPTNDYYEYNGKKLVRLNSILDSIKEIDTNYCAIVNSDIILDSSLKFKDIDNAIIIATRWEIDGNKLYPFNNGYDLFIFKKSKINLFYNKNYVIGMPWWDFWLPLIALKANMSVYHIKNKVISHRTHETNYDSEKWVEFGEFLYKDIIVNLMSRAVDVDIFSFCNTVKNYIEYKQKNIKIK